MDTSRVNLDEGTADDATLSSRPLVKKRQILDDSDNVYESVLKTPILKHIQRDSPYSQISDMSWDHYSPNIELLSTEFNKDAPLAIEEE